MNWETDGTWLQQSKDRELVLQFLSFEPHPVHRVPTYRFGMIHAETGEDLGGIKPARRRNSSPPSICRRGSGHRL